MKPYEANEAEGEDAHYRVVLRECDEYEPDSMYLATACLLVRGHSKRDPNTGLRPYIYAELRGYAQHKRAAAYWVVDAQCEQGDERRTQWNAVERFDTREEAAQWAADFMLHAITFWPRSCETGVLQPTPGMRRDVAAHDALDADDKHQALLLAYEHAEEQRKIHADGTEWHYASAHCRESKDVLDRYERTFVQDFHRTHDWRNFVR